MGLGLFDVPEDFDFDTIERNFKYDVVEPKGKYHFVFNYFDEFVEYMKSYNVTKVECREYFL